MQLLAGLCESQAAGQLQGSCSAGTHVAAEWRDSQAGVPALQVLPTASLQTLVLSINSVGDEGAELLAKTLSGGGGRRGTVVCAARNPAGHVLIFFAV